MSTLLAQARLGAMPADGLAPEFLDPGDDASEVGGLQAEHLRPVLAFGAQR